MKSVVKPAMLSAKLLLAGMYIHLVLSMAIPPALVWDTFSHQGWTPLSVGLLLVWLLEAGALQLLGWIAVGMAVRAGRRGELAALRSGWLLLKLGSIPFYLLNFFYSVFVWFALVAASRGVLILLVPIPVIYTWLLTVQSGCFGLCLLRRLSGRAEPPPGGIHSLLQLVPVLDVASTLLLRGRLDASPAERTPSCF